MSTKWDGMERAAKNAYRIPCQNFFISYADPATILALIAELRTLQAENERLKAVDETFGEYDH